MVPERKPSANLDGRVYEELHRISEDRHVTDTSRLRELLEADQRGSRRHDEQPPTDSLPPAPPDSA